MRPLWTAGSLFACWLAAASAAEPVTPEQFEWHETIRLATPGEAIYRLEIPQSVYAGSQRQDLGDLRVFNGAGQVVPHTLLNYEPPAQSDVKTQSVAFFPLYKSGGKGEDQVDVSVRQVAGGALMSTRVKSGGTAPAQRVGYIVDASAVGATRRAMLLEWQAQPAATVLSVRVEAGDDLQAWHPIAPGTQLVDLRSGEQRLQQNRIDLAGSPSRYFRILWSGDQEGILLSSAAIETTSAAVRPSRLQWAPAGPMRAGAAPGEFLFDSPGLPVEALRLRLPERNTVVQMTIAHRRTDREPWRDGTTTVVYHLVRGNEDLQSPPIFLCCSTDRFWRLVFDQRGGGIGQGVPQVELGWAPQQGLFVARGAEPFLLAYGNARVGSAGLIATALVPGYRPEQYPGFPEARFEAPVKRIAVGPVAPDVKALDWRSIGLWSVLVAGVVLLAAMVWRLLGQMNKGSNT